MTEDEREMLRENSRKTAEMHRLFMEPPAPGKPPLASEVHDLMSAWRAGRQVGRWSLWAFGFVAAATSAWAAMKGWWQK